MTGVRNKCNRRVLSYSGLQRTPVSRVCQEICSITPLPATAYFCPILPGITKLRPAWNWDN